VPLWPQELNRAFASVLPLLDMSHVGAVADSTSADSDTLVTIGHSVRLGPGAPSTSHAYLSCQLAAVRDIVFHDVKAAYLNKLLVATATSNTPVRRTLGRRWGGAELGGGGATLELCLGRVGMASPRLVFACVWCRPLQRSL
jgi:hypothetical protein